LTKKAFCVLIKTMDAGDIFAKIFGIGYVIYDAERARRLARQRSSELKVMSEKVTSTLPSTGALSNPPSKTENSEVPDQDATQTSQEPVTAEILGEESHSKPPVMVKERKELDPETMAWQLKQIRADLWELEGHLKNKCRGCGADVSCCYKHALNLIDIATETKSMTADPLWDDIIKLAEEVKVKCHPDAIKAETYFAELPSLTIRTSELRRAVEDKLIKLSKPELTLEEAMAEAAKLAQEEVEKLWQSREKK
jgi:hypothetical protein